MKECANFHSFCDFALKIIGRFYEVEYLGLIHLEQHACNFTSLLSLYSFNEWRSFVDLLSVVCSLTYLKDVDIIRGDFLDINPGDPLFAKVHAILLDPSCSGSGISVERLDHLLPSHSAGNGIDIANSRRINKLAAFQRKALEHALSFPLVERVVYSTCSIHQEENEDVVKSVLPLAASLGFELASPFPQWHHRGLPLFEGSEHLLRTDPADNLEGFFIALFVRKHLPDGNFHPEQCKQRCPSSENKHHRKRKRKRLMPLTVLRMSRRLLFHSALLTPSRI
ncbi:putative NOL1/NOP2/Sun domain family member 5B [Ananas comosus]|uniref:NOL1/NOP2/Sun domain family member 5B n=1 Tax=Ananas comosus TaxID=4615 RepID=A0A6P5FXJ6_ANACO|nr:putative NOL1/NOP2/Sun domain family member 5B [Ananas comosus]